MPDFLIPREDGVILKILVQPKASRNEITGLQDQELKIRLTSPPVEGAANDLCCRFLSKLLRIPKRDITIISGNKSRHKRLFLRTDNPETVRQTLAEKC